MLMGIIGSMSILQARPIHTSSTLCPGSTRDVTTLPLPRCRCRDVGDGDGKLVHTEGLEEVLGLAVDLKGSLSRGQSRDVGNVSGSQR